MDTVDICLARGAEVSVCTSTESEIEGSEERTEERTEGTGLDGRTEERTEGTGHRGRGDNDQEKLNLGHLLVALDGGSETPGRMVILTTNQEHLLDPALKRPGRLHSVRLDHLEFEEFKQMMLYLHNPPNPPASGLARDGSLSSVEIWSVGVEALAAALMRDFKNTNALRRGDMDKRQLGLSPALLEALCIGAETVIRHSTLSPL